MKDVSGRNSKYISDHDNLRWTGYQIRCKKHNLAWCCLQEIHPEKRCRSSSLMKWDQTSWANMNQRKPASVTIRQLLKWHWKEIMLTMGRTAHYSSWTKSHFLFLCIMFYQNTAARICFPVFFGSFCVVITQLRRYNRDFMTPQPTQFTNWAFRENVCWLLN